MYGVASVTKSFTAQPRTAAPDDLTFEVVTDSGVKTPLTFKGTDDGVGMFFQRWRLGPA